MYEAFFGLRERPFDLTPDPRFLVLTDSHREVLGNLEYGISSRKGVTVVIGEAGSGKTTLIRTVIARQPLRVLSVHINNPTLSRQEFVETLAAKFGLSDRATASKASMLSELETLLRARNARGETTVLIVDEAQSLSLELLEEIRLLANTETDHEKLLPVILAGQPELADRLNEQALRQLKQRVALRCELRPMSDRETAAYIAGRIAIAGGTASQVFTREAVSLMHRASSGVPRLVSVLADNALLGGFARGQKPVSSQIVREVCRDFDQADGGSAPAEPPSERKALPGSGTLDAAPRSAPAASAAGSVMAEPAPGSAGLFSFFTPKRKRFFSRD